MEKLFIYDNGELAEVQEKSFIFELAMEGYIVDNPVLLSNECLDLKDPEAKKALRNLLTQSIGLTSKYKVARTIADLEGSEKVQSQHIAEAIGYRNLDRGDWAERGL